MTSATYNHPDMRARNDAPAPSSTPLPTAARADHAPSMLHCTDDIPDSRYWTAYDHYMIEREAAAMRRAYIYQLVATAWRKLTGKTEVTRAAGNTAEIRA